MSTRSFNYFESELFFRDRPFIKNVSFGGAWKKCYIFKIGEQSLQVSSKREDWTTNLRLLGNLGCVDLVTDLVNRESDKIMTLITCITRTDFEHHFSQLFRVRVVLTRWTFYKKIFFLLGHEKNVIYSKLVNNPFKNAFSVFFLLET